MNKLVFTPAIFYVLLYFSSLSAVTAEDFLGVTIVDERVLCDTCDHRTEEKLSSDCGCDDNKGTDSGSAVDVAAANGPNVGVADGAGIGILGSGSGDNSGNNNNARLLTGKKSSPCNSCSKNHKTDCSCGCANNNGKCGHSGKTCSSSNPSCGCSAVDVKAANGANIGLLDGAGIGIVGSGSGDNSGNNNNDRRLNGNKSTPCNSCSKNNHKTDCACGCANNNNKCGHSGKTCSSNPSCGCSVVDVKAANGANVGVADGAGVGILGSGSGHNSGNNNN